MSRINAQTYFYLVTCVLIWGSNWPLVKIALSDCPPYTFMLLRTVGAVVVLALVILASRHRSLLPIRGERQDLALVGLLSFFGALTCSTVGLKYIHVGRAMLLMYTMQLWAVPLGVLLLGEQASRVRVMGSLVGFSGVICFLIPGPLTGMIPMRLSEARYCCVPQ